MNYEVQGKGFPLVLVHGLGGDSRNWRFQVEEFSKRYRVFVPDLRGHGRSEAPDSKYTLSAFTEDIVEFLKMQGVSKCYYVGLSMGGMIGQNLAITHPELLEALVLADTSPTPGKLNRPGYENDVKMFEASANIAEKKGRAPLADVTMKMMFTEKFIDKNPKVTDEVKKLIVDGPSTGYVNAIRSIILTELDMFPHLPDIVVPTLIVVGRQDALTPVAESKRMHEAIKKSQLEIIENCGHVSVIEQHAEFNRILRHFLKQLDTIRYMAPTATIKL